MKFLGQFNTTFDRFLFIGIGCGSFVLCILLTSLLLIWRNPPRTRPTELAAGDLATVTPGTTSTPLFEFATPSAFPTGSVTFAPTSLAASPVPGSDFNNVPLTGHIVFTCFVNSFDQICLMNGDGSGRRQLTNADATSYYASISPDGDTIYFVSRATGTFEIYSMNLRGKELRQLTRNIGSLYAPDRSPTDDRIVFTNQTGGTQQIWIMRVDGKNPHAITNGPEDIDPTWSPDGSMIAFASARTGQRQLYVMDRDGSEVRQVTNLPNMGGRSTWSRDGRRLAFYAGPTGDHNIYVINIDGTGLVQLTNGGDNLGPSWSTDGNWITFTSFRDGNNEVYVIHPDGTGVMRLTNNPASDWQPRWGP